MRPNRDAGQEHMLQRTRDNWIPRYVRAVCMYACLIANGSIKRALFLVPRNGYVYITHGVIDLNSGRIIVINRATY